MRTIEVDDIELSLLAIAVYDSWHDARDEAEEGPEYAADRDVLAGLYKKVTGRDPH